jgi:carbon storage regulator
MLVLSRKKKETIVIGNNICITLLDVRGSHVRLGIEAPAEVPIRRAELPEKPPANKPAAERPAGLAPPRRRPREPGDQARPHPGHGPPSDGWAIGADAPATTDR